jgi:hypothetical protein
LLRRNAIGAEQNLRQRAFGCLGRDQPGVYVVHDQRVVGTAGKQQQADRRDA